MFIVDADEEINKTPLIHVRKKLFVLFQKTPDFVFLFPYNCVCDTGVDGNSSWVHHDCDSRNIGLHLRA